MKFILGLDIGTNSLGWYLLRLENRKYEIVDRGVLIFPIGTIVDAVKGLEKTKHTQRRLFRLTARNRDRRKLRKWKLAELLKRIDFLPERLEKKDFHFLDTHKIKNHYQSFELYQLRTKALDEAIKKSDLGRLFFLLNNYRGFKSSSKSLSDEIDNKKNDDEGKVKGGIETLNEFMMAAEARTYGEYFFKMHLKAKDLYDRGEWHNPNEPIDERALDENGAPFLTESHGIRREHGRYTSRKIYENEFDLIWERQKQYYPDALTGSKKEYEALQEKMYEVPKEERRRLINEFKKTSYWKIKYACIYYQRPLKSAKKYIGKCQFEKNKQGAPISSYSFQSFRIWKQLSDIRYTNQIGNVFNQPLEIEWKKLIFQYLQTHGVVHLKSGKNKTGICGLLNMDEKNTSFNFDNENDDKYIKGNTTYTAIFKILGNETFDKLIKEVDRNGDNKVEKLWHLLYMKKDDEWLRITLNDKISWPELTAVNIDLLADVTLEDGYAAFSSKAINKLLPTLELGFDEHTAFKKAGYKDIDQTFDEQKWHPNSKISNIKNGELRNPVVEKAVTETIRLVNSITDQYFEIDKYTWEIHVETTRDLKKPKKERERMRRENSSKDELREEYARFLNEQRSKGRLQGVLKGEIFKNSPIINKFELWLEMGGDKNDEEFEHFVKVAKLDSEQRIKHKLWLECNRVCPYTEKVISLSQLFSSDTEIEHIIPLSRGLDNSFNNKTLTFHKTNKEKGNKTAYEYLKHDKSYEKRINSGFFSKEKKENFLRQNVPVDFTHAQLSNTSYIAKYVRVKLQEVCKPHQVYFTNGKVTAELRNHDWRLGNLLDKVRYEESSGHDIDFSLQRFNILKKYFYVFLKTREGYDVKLPKSVKDFTTDIQPCLVEEFDKKNNENLNEILKEISLFETYRSASGKKDRSDHRHHSLDALITALCSPIITKELSTINASRENSGEGLYNEYGELSREKIELQLDYNSIKQSLKNILVVNKTNQRLIVSKKNKIKTAVEILVHPSKSIRTSLHQDTYYGKLKNPALQDIDRAEAYMTRFDSFVWDFTDTEKLAVIYDKDLREILKRRIIWFKQKNIIINEQAYQQYPLFRYSPSIYPDVEPECPVSHNGKALPVVKKVRTLYKNYRNIISLPKGKYAAPDGNYIMALYELRENTKNDKIKIIRGFRLLSSFDAVHKKMNGQQLFPDEIKKNEKHLPLMEGCNYLRQGDLVIMYEDEIDKEDLDWNNQEDLKKRLFKVVMLSSEENYGLMAFLKHNISSQKMSYPKGAFQKGKKQLSMTMRHTQINAIKVKIDNLGKIWVS